MQFLKQHLFYNVFCLDFILLLISASGFHLPKDHTKPIILIGPGTGIAPYRSFWQHLNYLKEQDPNIQVKKNR